MLSIKDRILSHNTSKATLNFDENHLSIEDNPRLTEMRDKFIRSVYQLLKSDEFKDLYLKYDEQIDAKISIKHDAIEIEY